MRGVVTVDLTVKIIKNGMHSGDCSGIVPSTFRIARQLLERIEDSRTGELLVPELYLPLTPALYEKATNVVKVLGERIITKIEWEEGCEPVTNTLVEAFINRTLRPTLCLIGIDGIPPSGIAGNVLRPYSAFFYDVINVLKREVFSLPFLFLRNNDVTMKA